MVRNFFLSDIKVSPIIFGKKKANLYQLKVLAGVNQA